MLGLATRMVSDYGKLLKDLDPGLYGLPESLLPHDKERLRQALRLLLRRVDASTAEIADGLLRGLVYLAQFVPDEEAMILARGQSSLLDASQGDRVQIDVAERAMRIINRIKLDMESALDEGRALLLSGPG